MELAFGVRASGGLLSGKGHVIVQANLDAFVTEVTMFLLVEVQKRTPQGVYGAQGGLLGSIQAEVTGKGTPQIKGTVMSSQKYAEVIEKGRTPGKAMPPKGSLVQWIELKLGLSEQQAQRIEFVIRRKIGVKGFEGREMFERAVSDNMSRIEAMAAARGLVLAAGLRA